ncbi:MAG: SPOR domain-containing protein [Proteobacteria bacterium]|uniref:SPOR domain-containing protein n=1 Tax=Candidatus Avisuccinivibrio stercorigallinarum TaxID=2840704 RepID=A0A9D9D989_9GAMM|nr:SPOR domain-containing protein [Candidatus Avisuccinivibrio stercorigallinarum]
MGKSKKPALKFGPRQKKIVAVAAVLLIVLIFVSFLLSLSGGDDKAEGSSAHSEAAQSTQQSGELQIPASQRYDYSNMLNEPQQPAPAAEQNQNPFAGMKPENGSLPSPAPAPAPGTQVQPAPVPATDHSAAGAQPAAGAQSASRQAVLFCGSFASAKEAESQKALIAFQGIVSEVQPRSGAYTLMIGPFPNREEARVVFGNLADKGLVSECSLTDY